MKLPPFVSVAEDLEIAGLIWRPEIGDEVSNRNQPTLVSVLVDPQGMTPTELRSAYLWLPTVEQMVIQLEVRQAILFHAGVEMTERSLSYKTVIQAPIGQIETMAESLRLSVGIALRNLLLSGHETSIN
jgi:hypothetical protein